MSALAQVTLQSVEERELGERSCSSPHPPLLQHLSRYLEPSPVTQRSESASLWALPVLQAKAIHGHARPLLGPPC